MEIGRGRPDAEGCDGERGKDDERGLWRREERKRQGQMMMIRIRPEEEGERATSTGRERLSRLGLGRVLSPPPNII